MKGFDEKFNEQVKHAFGSYNADHLADAGWNALQQKKSKSKKFLAIAPLWAKAATIAILIAIGGLITFRLANYLNDSQVVEIVRSDLEPITSVDSIQSPETIIAKVAIEGGLDSIVKIENERPANMASRLAQVETIATADSSSIIIADNHEDNPLADKIEGTVEFKADDNALLALNEQHDEPADEIDQQEPLVTAVAESNNEKVLPLQPLIIPADEPSSDRKTNFGAGFSGMMAMVDEMVSTSPGIALGVYAEHKLNDRISVRPGIYLAKHSYSLQGISDTYSNSSPSFDGIAGESVSHENHLDIVALEVPINIVFQLFKRRNRIISLTAGASTLVYLNQHFTGKYIDRYNNEVFNSTTGQWETATSYTQVNVDNWYGAFSRTDFFGLANLAIGYSFPMGKNSLLIEPFIQIPVGEITSSNLRMGFGGVSLKYKLER
jgi:hypothetical protein